MRDIKTFMKRIVSTEIAKLKSLPCFYLFKPTNMKIVHLGNRFVLYPICAALRSENYIERVSRAQKFFAHNIFETIVVQMELLPRNYESRMISGHQNFISELMEIPISRSFVTQLFHATFGLLSSAHTSNAKLQIPRNQRHMNKQRFHNYRRKQRTTVC